MTQATLKKLFVHFVDIKNELLSIKFHLEHQFKLPCYQRLSDMRELTDPGISSLIDEYYDKVHEINTILDELEKDIQGIFVYRGNQPLK